MVHLQGIVSTTVVQLIQSPLVIVDPIIVEALVIVDRLCRLIVYFSMYFSRNSGITRYSGQISADGHVHYCERRLYIYFYFLLFWISCDWSIDKKSYGMKKCHIHTALQMSYIKALSGQCCRLNVLLLFWTSWAMIMKIADWICNIPYHDSAKD